MAGGLRKDVELIFRGTDKASPSIKSVRQEVSGLTSAIQDQISAASKGEGSIDELAKAYNALKSAQGDVTEITKLAVAYESLGQKHAEAASKAEAAADKEKQLAAQVAAAEKPTKRLLNQREAAGRAAESSAAREAALAAQVKEAGAAFEAAGGDLKNFQASQEAIRQTALQTARALSEASAAMDNFKSIQAGGLQQKAAAGADTQFNALAATSGLPPAQIQFISGMQNKVQALTAAIKENEASLAAWHAELASRETDNAALQVNRWATALAEAEAAQERLKTTTAFKAQAAEIEAAAMDVERFGATMDTAAQTSRRFAQSIDAILNPTQSAARNLQEVNAVIEQAEQTMVGAKARMSDYNKALNDLQAVAAGLNDTARNIDGFSAQEAAVAKAQATFDAAQADVLRYAAAIREADNPTKEMVGSLTQAEGALDKAGGALQRENTKLAELSAKLETAGVDVRDLASAEKQLEAAAQRAAAAQQALRNKTSGTGGFLGLNPQDLTNFGYQVNDIIVGLASGQKPLTVFIQQGFQIGQLFRGILPVLLEFAPLIVALAGPIIAVGQAIGQVADNSARLQNANVQLKSMAEVASGVDAKGLADVQKKLEDIGVAAKDVTPILREMMTDGLNIAQMQQYIDTAKSAAEVTGVDFKTAFDNIRESFSGGYDDILKLQDATGVYTDAELKLIEQLFNHGQADEARATALEIYQNKMDHAADSANGPWSKALDNLAAAWHRVIDAIANSSVIQNTTYFLDQLGRSAQYWTGRLAGKTDQQAMAEAYGNAPGTRKPRQVQVADPNRTTAGGQKAIRDQQDALAAAKATTAAEKARLAGRKALNAAIAAGATNQEAEKAAALATQAAQAQEDQRAAKRGASAAKRRARQAESAAKQIANQEEQLQRQLEQIDAAVGKTQTESLAERLGAIDDQYAKLFRSIDEYAKKTNGKGKIGDMTIQQARDHVEQQKTELKNYATMQFEEKQIQGLLSERKQKLDEIADRVARGIITPEQGLTESNQVIDEMAGKINDMATQALAFAEGLRSAVPNPQLEAFIAKLKSTIQTNSGGQNVRQSNEVAQQYIQTAEGGLNNVISQRAALIQRENTLVALGMQTQAAARDKIKGYYAETLPLVQQHIDQIRNLADQFKNSADPAMQLYYQSLMAHLQEVEVQAQFVDERFLRMKQGIDQLITQNIVGFIDSVAQAFANLVTGKGDILDFFGSIGLAFAQMIAKTLQGIAQLIIQAIILDAVDKATGGLIKPLLKLYGSVHHGGGIAGQAGGRSRAVSPLVFAGAPRYHSGGIAGMAPDEVGSILKKGEEVLTEADPRHRKNGGLSPAAAPQPKQLRQVLAFGDDQIAAAMSGEAGEEVTVTHIRRNAPRIRAALGI